MTSCDLDNLNTELQGCAQLALMGEDGNRMSIFDRQELQSREPTYEEWVEGLTSMRRVMREETDARIALGGRVEGYLGNMPGIAEEALLSLQAEQPGVPGGWFRWLHSGHRQDYRHRP